jgi:hypothetical protein
MQQRVHVKKQCEEEDDAERDDAERNDAERDDAERDDAVPTMR